MYKIWVFLKDCGVQSSILSLEVICGIHVLIMQYFLFIVMVRISQDTVREGCMGAGHGESCVRVFLSKYINLQNYLRWGIQVFGKRVDKRSYGAFRKWDINCMTSCYILVTCHKFIYLLALCSTIINQIYTFSINAYRLTNGSRIYEIG